MAAYAACYPQCCSAFQWKNITQKKARIGRASVVVSTELTTTQAGSLSDLDNLINKNVIHISHYRNIDPST